jgi:hypothetical protein
MVEQKDVLNEELFGKVGVLWGRGSAVGAVCGEKCYWPGR